MPAPPGIVRGEQAVDRVLRILGMFGERRSRLSAAEVAAELGVHRSTATRLLQSLERHNLLERASDGHGYVLGLGLVSLAGHVLSRFPVRAAAGDLIRSLRDSTGESTWLGVLAGDEVIYIDQASSPHVRLGSDWVGRRQKLTAGSTGSLLLAFQGPAMIAEMLERVRRQGDGAPPSETELARVRAQGFLARYPDSTGEQAVVAAPIRDQRSEVIAVVSLSGPLHRIDERRHREELIPAVVHTGRLISERLGCPEAFSPASRSA